MENQPKSRWQQFRESVGSESANAQPWHLINPTLRSEESVTERRMSICRACDRFILPTNQCRECGCIMTMKTRLTNAKCPLSKW